MVSALPVSPLDGKIPAPFQTVILLLMVWQHQERERKNRQCFCWWWEERQELTCWQRHLPAGVSSLCPKQQHVRVQLSPWHVSGKGKSRERRCVFRKAEPTSRAGLEASQEKPLTTSKRARRSCSSRARKLPEVLVEKMPRANRQGKR